MFKNYFQHTEKKNHKHPIPQKFNWQRTKVNVRALTYSMHLKGTKHMLLAHAYLIGPCISYWPMHILLALHILLPLHILSPCNQVTQSKTCVSLPTLPRKMYGYVAPLRLPTFSCQSTNPGLNLLPSYIIFIN